MNLYVLSGSSVKEEKIFVANTVDISGLVTGQMIEYSKNIKDEIINLKVQYDYKNNIKSGFSSIGSNMGATGRAVFGKVAKFEDGQILIVDDEASNVNTAVGEIFSYKTFQSQGRVYVYDTEKRKDPVTKASDGDIFDYASTGENCSRAVVLTSMCWPVAMIIYN